jgi:Domain of unknown function (DUF4333)
MGEPARGHAHRPRVCPIEPSCPRPPGLATAVVVSILLAASLAGCGKTEPTRKTEATLNTVTVERAIASSILAQRHLHARVSCPSETPRKAGLLFTCTASLDVGTYRVSATEINGAGRVRYQNKAPLVVLDIAKVERAIEQSIRSQRHLPSTVTCPAEVIQRAGIAFTCKASVGGRSYPFAVREVDGDGHVRYEGR